MPPRKPLALVHAGPIATDPFDLPPDGMAAAEALIDKPLDMTPNSFELPPSLVPPAEVLPPKPALRVRLPLIGETVLYSFPMDDPNLVNCQVMMTAFQVTSVDMPNGPQKAPILANGWVTLDPDFRVVLPGGAGQPLHSVIGMRLRAAPGSRHTPIAAALNAVHQIPYDPQCRPHTWCYHDDAAATASAKAH